MSVAVFVGVTAVMLYRRRDLLPVALVSGASLAVLMVAAYQVVLPFHQTLFNDYWMLENLSGRNNFV